MLEILRKVVQDLGINILCVPKDETGHKKGWKGARGILQRLAE